jgi:hypothetical protein
LALQLATSVNIKFFIHFQICGLHFLKITIPYCTGPKREISKILNELFLHYHTFETSFSYLSHLFLFFPFYRFLSTGRKLLCCVCQKYFTLRYKDYGDGESIAYIMLGGPLCTQHQAFCILQCDREMRGRGLIANFSTYLFYQGH